VIELPVSPQYSFDVQPRFAVVPVALWIVSDCPAVPIVAGNTILYPVTLADGTVSVTVSGCALRSFNDPVVILCANTVTAVAESKIIRRSPLLKVSICVLSKW
jgi:hypothetical protein